MEEGKDTKGIQRRYPEIKSAYELYLMSRQRSVVVATVPKGKDQQKSVIASYTTGYGVLPEPGGLLDQPYRLMEFWSLFLDGDRIATLKSLS